MKIESLGAVYAVTPGLCEDSLALRLDERGGAMCVADGCGGLGSRRYERLDNATGAFLASRLVSRAFMRYAEEHPAPPRDKNAGHSLLTELESELHGVLERFGDKNCRDAAGAHIVGSMQRTLPTTLCAALLSVDGDAADACCLWAGDSRCYALDANGLHQLTRDHARGEPDALASLYGDAPLSNLLSADQPARLSARRVRLSAPCLILCATDGAFGCLTTPMEFEMLLLSTMNAASGMDNWRRKLEIAFGRLAHDDASMTCAALGFADFAGMSAHFAKRREALRERFIAPVRRRGAAAAREKWDEYKPAYDWTEGKDDETDWRI